MSPAQGEDCGYLAILLSDSFDFGADCPAWGERARTTGSGPNVSRLVPVPHFGNTEPHRAAGAAEGMLRVSLGAFAAGTNRKPSRIPQRPTAEHPAKRRLGAPAGSVCPLCFTPCRAPPGSPVPHGVLPHPVLPGALSCPVVGRRDGANQTPSCSSCNSCHPVKKAVSAAEHRPACRKNSERGGSSSRHPLVGRG